LSIGIIDLSIGIIDLSIGIIGIFGGVLSHTPSSIFCSLFPLHTAFLSFTLQPFG
jgi:uncharacterized membrane protein YbaN (DUF454 family)